MKKLFMPVIEGMGAAAFYSLIVGCFAGWAYWMWLAIQLGSFGMFFIGLVPLLQFVLGPIGLVFLLFGVPDWIVRTFG